MRYALLAATLLAIATQGTAQLIAGEVPPGSTALELDVEISIPIFEDADSALIDLDCDEVPDILVILDPDYADLDGSEQRAMMIMLDDELEVCRTGIYTGTPRALYHSEGEALICTGPSTSWSPFEIVILGNQSGQPGPDGPSYVDSSYIAVRRGGDVIWIQVSFSLDLFSPWLTVHRALSFCGLSTGIASMERNTPSIQPSLTAGEPLQVTSASTVLSIEISDAAGRMVAQHGQGTWSIPAPDMPGLYTARILTADGTRSVSRFARE